MEIKALFFDIDGTLVPFTTHQVSEATRRDLHALRRKGYRIFIATGRPQLLINNLDGLVFDGYVTLNGAHCFLPDGTQLYQSQVPQADIERLIRFYRDHPYPLVFVDRHRWFITDINQDVETISRIIDIDYPPVCRVEEARSMEVLQMMGYFGAEKDDEIFTQVLSGCERMRWHPLFTDIIAHGNSKSHGIECMLAHFGIERQSIMAFGDGGNDIQMLDFAGIGVAMGNATPDIQAHADFVTRSVDEDGISHALRHFGLLDC